MVKQKSGLHKQVGAIFDGVINPNETSAEGGVSQAVKPLDGAYFRPDDIEQQSTEPIQAPKDLPQAAPAKPLSAPPPAPKPQMPAREVMLPASLTAKPSGMKLLDKIKIKLAELEQKGGRRQVISVVAIPFLTIGLIAVLWNNLAPPSRNNAKIAQTDGQTVAAQSSKGAINWQAVSPFSKSLRDPMAAYQPNRAGEGQGDVSLDNIIVNGILYVDANPQLSVATVNGQDAKIGDEIAGYKVIGIGRDFVELQKEGKKETKRMGQ